jgi:hypothetical protein
MDTSACGGFSRRSAGWRARQPPSSRLRLGRLTEPSQAHRSRSPSTNCEDDSRADRNDTQKWNLRGSRLKTRRIAKEFADSEALAERVGVLESVFRSLSVFIRWSPTLSDSAAWVKAYKPVIRYTPSRSVVVCYTVFTPHPGFCAVAGHFLYQHVSHRCAAGRADFVRHAKQRQVSLLWRHGRWRRDNWRGTHRRRRSRTLLLSQPAAKPTHNSAMPNRRVRRAVVKHSVGWSWFPRRLPVRGVAGGKADRANRPSRGDNLPGHRGPILGKRERSIRHWHRRRERDDRCIARGSDKPSF